MSKAGSPQPTQTEVTVAEGDAVLRAREAGADFVREVEGRRVATGQTFREPQDFHRQEQEAGNGAGSA